MTQMPSDEVLRRYRAEQFTDADVTRCTGLSVRGWRELIKHRAVRTVTERRGPGPVRRDRVQARGCHFCPEPIWCQLSRGWADRVLPAVPPPAL